MEHNDTTDVGDGLTAGLSPLVKQFDGTIARRGEVTGVFTGLPIAHFNPIHCWRDSPNLAEDLTAVIAHAEAASLNIKIVVPVGSSHEQTVADVAHQNGFVAEPETAPGMVLRNPNVPELPEGLTCSTPHGAAAATAVAEVMADAFEMPMEFSAMLSTEASLALPDTEWVTLALDDQTVATAMLAMTGDIAAVFNVAVPTAFRRRGFGAAATWEVARRGLELGARVTVLESTESGEPLYRAMGFEVVSQHRTFLRP